MRTMAWLLPLVVVCSFLNAFCDAQFRHTSWSRTHHWLGRDMWHVWKRIWWTAMWIAILHQAFPLFDGPWHVVYWALLSGIGTLCWDVGAHVGGHPEWGIWNRRRSG